MTYLPNSHVFGDTDISERVYLVQDIDPDLEDTDITAADHGTDIAAMQSSVSDMETAMPLKADLVAGQVPSAQLPSFASIGETSTTAYRGDRGKIAYDHSQVTTGNPHNVTKSNVGLSNVPNTDATARANHTGTQPASTITGLAAVATSGDYDDLSDKPTIKRVETYTGTTNASGDYTVTYATAFATTPDVQPQLQAPTNTQSIRITNSTTTGFTVKAVNRVDVIGLLPTYSNVSGASVGVLVTAR
jgi:hypothetical protein